jgi:hypothetical protein
MTLKNGVTTTATSRREKECPTEEYSSSCHLFSGGFYRFLLLFWKISSGSELHWKQ